MAVDDWSKEDVCHWLDPNLVGGHMLPGTISKPFQKRSYISMHVFSERATEVVFSTFSSV